MPYKTSSKNTLNLPRVAYFDDNVDNLKLYETLLSNDFHLDLITNPFSYKEVINGSHSAILIDLHMPGMDGIELHQMIKLHPDYNQCPVLFISTDLTEELKFKTISSGGVDFFERRIKKEEVLLRLTNKINFFQHHKNIFILGSLKLNLSELKIYLKSKTVDVTLTELKILKLLVKKFPEIVSRDELWNDVWPGQSAHSSTLNTHLSNLRSKFKDWEYDITSIKMKGIHLLRKES